MDFRSLQQGFVITIILLQLQNCWTNAFDYDDDNDSSSRCPWIRNKLKNGRVKIRSRGRIAKFLCDPGYELAGKRFATCVRGQWNNPIPVCVARGCPKLPEPANGRVTEMYRGALLMYDCLPGYVLDGDMSVFCDGRRWNTSLPACVVAKDNPAMSCDFESPDLCGWNHDPTHDFDWQRNQHSTPSGHVGTGPSFDHTYGEGKGGFYLYIEASSPRKVNDTSRIFSPVFPMDYSGGCFSFWYHMYGSTTGGLRVYIRPESSVFDEVSPTWEKFGDQGNQWRMGNISIPYFDQNFQIVIEGIRGTSYIGDTAIDDVNLSTTGCDSIGNATESSIEISDDSCRGRCHESLDVTVTECGCDDSCYPDNCCSDYQLICTSGTSSVSDNPEELPAGDLLPTTNMLSTIYDTTKMLSTIESVTVEKHSSVDSSYVTTPTESSGMYFASETEAFIRDNISTTIPLTTSSSVSTDNLSPIPTDSSSFNSTGESSSISPDGTSPSPTESSSPSPRNSSLSTPTDTSTLIYTDSSSLIPTNSSLRISTDSSFNISSLPFNNYSSSAIISTDKSFAFTTDSLSAVATDIVTPIVTNYSSPKISMSTETKISISTTEYLTTREILQTENKIPIDHPTTAYINTTKLLKNATNLDLVPTMEPLRITSTVIANSSEVPIIFPNTTVKEITSPTDSPRDVLLTSSSTRRTYNLRPRTKRTTATEWIDATTIPITFPKVSTNTNKETAISTSSIIYRYTTHKADAGVSTTEGFPFRNTDMSSKSSRETIFHAKQSTMPTLPLTNRLSTGKYIHTTPFVSRARITTSHPETIDNSDSRFTSTSVNSDATVPIISVTLILAVASVGGWIFYIRRKQEKRQSKLSDDSELRYLQANEITDY